MNYKIVSVVWNLKTYIIFSFSVSIKIGNVDWYKLNWHFMNYYRVNYPPAHWLTLTNLLLRDIKVACLQDVWVLCFFFA